MTKVNAYLNFNGNCEEAFNFYKSVFGGEFSHISRFGDMPAEPNAPEMPAEMKKLIMHLSYTLGENVLFGSDTSEEFGGLVTFGNNFSLSVTMESKEEADRVFAELEVGGTIKMPLATTFWGSYFGMVLDRFGINWMVDFYATPEE